MLRVSHFALSCTPAASRRCVCRGSKGFGAATTSRPAKPQKAKPINSPKTTFDSLLQHRTEALDILHHHLATDVQVVNPSTSTTSAAASGCAENERVVLQRLSSSSIAHQLHNLEQTEDGREQSAAHIPRTAHIDVEVVPATAGLSEVVQHEGVVTSTSGESDLAEKIARLWDGVPDELRQLMAESKRVQHDLDTSIADDNTVASGSSENTMAASLAAVADIDALLAPLQADYHVESEGYASFTGDDHMSTADYTHSQGAGSGVASQRVAAPLSTQDQPEPEQHQTPQPEDTTIQAAERALDTSLQVQHLEEALLKSQQEAEALRAELECLKAKQNSSSDDHNDRSLAGLEVEVTRIANKLLETSLAMDSATPSHRRQLKAIVNELLALDFGN